MNISGLANRHKALGDPVRIKIIKLLSDTDYLCVCKIVPALNISQPRVSQHLRILRDAGLVTSRREGKWVHYKLERDRLDELIRETKSLIERR